MWPNYNTNQTSLYALPMDLQWYSRQYSVYWKTEILYFRQRNFTLYISSVDIQVKDI